MRRKAEGEVSRLCSAEGWVGAVGGGSDDGTGADRGWRRNRVASWRGLWMVF